MRWAARPWMLGQWYENGGRTRQTIRFTLKRSFFSKPGAIELALSHSAVDARSYHVPEYGNA